MRIGVVGCGRIGARRARIAFAAGDVVSTVADLDGERADALASEAGASVAGWQDVVTNCEVDAVVVATHNKSLFPVALAALDAGKHVLCEKPLGRNSVEARDLVEAADAAGVILKTGFNHRYHPAISSAHDLVRSGGIGPPLFIRAAYGHGGRPGYDKEWRGDPELAGGGELLDQGVHLVDLCRWFLGDFVEVSGSLATWFWDVAPLEDNAFAMLRTAAGQLASIHSSWTQWKNVFRFEIFGRDGYVTIEGLGGSYGPPSLIHGRRRAESGPPEETEQKFPSDDRTWDLEWNDFLGAIAEQRRPLGDGRDGLAAARVIDAIYASAQKGSPVTLDPADR
ncbi:MAG: Gfo/Idh/MocA family oxidoreductase [Actinomycetota bacterium]|nr:Gfo/Idh/MocA family oxidoreductase [Actinomycetota bacterium]